MKKMFFVKKMPALAAVLCLAFALAGCDGTGSPANNNQNVGGNEANGNGGQNGNNVHVPSWSGPHRLAAFDAFDWWSDDIAFGNGRFFVVGDIMSEHGFRPLVKTSTNGITWSDVTETHFSDFEYVRGITFGGGRFFAYGYTCYEHSLLVKTSMNGTVWNDVTEDFSVYFTWMDRIVYSGGRIFAFGEWFDPLMDDWIPLAKTSTDGSNWVDLTDRLDSFCLWRIDIVHGAGRFFALGWDSSRNHRLIKTSTNGTTWVSVTPSDFGDFRNVTDIASGGGRFFVFGSAEVGGFLIKTSTSGSNWVDVTSNFGVPGNTFGFHYVLFAAGRFYAFGVRNDGNNNWHTLVKSSTDGTSWVEETFLANNIQMTEAILILHSAFYSGARTFIFTEELEEVADGSGRLTRVGTFVFVRE